MYQAKEARGLDIIPNLAFWKDLPFLIKVTNPEFNTLFIC